MKFNTIFTKNDKINRIQMETLKPGTTNTVQAVMPLSFRMPDGNYWKFPTEPLVSVSGKNIVKKRNVLKNVIGHGTIKERWAEDDYQINIQGTFVGTGLNTYPTYEMTLLSDLLRQRKPINVLCDLLQQLDIHHIVVESYSFPFSKGENIQNFTIEAVSDDLYTLFKDVVNV